MTSARDSVAGRVAVERVAVGISGASGVIYGIRLLEALRDAGVETHLILTEAGAEVVRRETDRDPTDVEALADRVYDNDDFGAALASGSFPMDAAVIAPCSVKSLSSVANSYTDTLLARASDVTLKEGRPLVLVFRETPLHRGHLRLMAMAAEAGAVIMPPMPAFYHGPKTIEDLVDHLVGKVLDRLGVGHHLFRRWEG